MARLAVQQAQGASCLYLPVLGLRCTQPCLAFHGGAGDLPTGAHAYTAADCLRTEPSPHPRFYLTTVL